ncbi:MAG TPA: hypothetical protein VNN08_07230 [Thermoanaerobaculia bacterium]|nr:hypothetical protein [Thermoanaerobaculia bacterium]
MSTQKDVPARRSHTDTAQAMIEQARAMRQQVPNFVVPSSRSESQRLIKAASVPPEFVELSAVAVTNSTPLLHGGALEPALTRDLTRFADACDPVADELEALAQFIRHSTLAARNRAGSGALTAYALAKVLAKRPETADLAPHVADMRRALNRGRKAKSQQPSSTETSSSPETPNVTPSPDTASNE